MQTRTIHSAKTCLYLFYCILLTDVILIEGTICSRVEPSMATNGPRGTVYSAMFIGGDNPSALCNYLYSS